MQCVLDFSSHMSTAFWSTEKLDLIDDNLFMQVTAVSPHRIPHIFSFLFPRSTPVWLVLQIGMAPFFLQSCKHLQDLLGPFCSSMQNLWSRNAHLFSTPHPNSKTRLHEPSVIHPPPTQPTAPKPPNVAVTLPHSSVRAHGWLQLYELWLNSLGVDGLEACWGGARDGIWGENIFGGTARIPVGSRVSGGALGWEDSKGWTMVWTNLAETEKFPQKCTCLLGLWTSPRTSCISG